MTDQPLSYWIALARMGFEDDFNRLFDELGISRAELAERLGTTPAYVSKILNGRNGNFQLETLVKWARAIDAILQIRLIKGEGEVVRVVDYETARALDDVHGAGLPKTKGGAITHQHLSESMAGTLLPPVADFIEYKAKRSLPSESVPKDIIVTGKPTLAGG